MPMSQSNITPSTPVGATLVGGGGTFKVWAPASRGNKRGESEEESGSPGRPRYVSTRCTHCAHRIPGPPGGRSHGGRRFTSLDVPGARRRVSKIERAAELGAHWGATPGHYPI